jgi:predicted PurR-regulated permease PerM
VNQIINQSAGKRASASTAVIVIICGAFVLVASLALAAAADGSRPIRSQFEQHALQLAAEPATAPAPPQETDEDDKDVPTSQVDKYISVYESMQKDHNLTVEQAASKQGLTVEQFRALENKIEADDTLRERVRKALRHAANPNDKSATDD